MAQCSHGGTAGKCDLCTQEKNLNAGKGRSRSEGVEAGRRNAKHQIGKPKPRKK